MYRQLLGYCNLVVGNEEEFIALAERLRLDADDAASAAQSIAAFHFIPPERSQDGAMVPRFTQRKFHELERILEESRKNPARESLFLGQKNVS